ncbi:MAG: RHS repeat-associated core domain-containing protein, partial [Hylemonella sp.]|nr:RHS repeat-associated core domain-containing protein [Hylemonella sp.]
NTRVKTTVGSAYGTVTTYEFRSAHGLLLAEWRKISGYYDNLTESVYLAGKAVAEQQTDFIPGGSSLPVSWLFIQSDANGSPISSTWSGGGLLFKENYQPYGSQLNGTASPWTKMAFAGRTQDKIDLIYMGGRYYNPVIGRFLSVDPKEADPSDLHSLNRYAYANNNPYRYVDPDGYSPVDLAFFAIDAVKLGQAIYSGGDVKGAAIDLGLSAVGILSPVPGTGQALKTLKVADKVVDGVRAADNVVGAAKVTASDLRAAGRSDFEAARASKLAENGGKCTYCGRGSSTEVDHVKSLKSYASDVNAGKLSKADAAREANAPGNLAGACTACNRGPGGKHANELSSEAGPGKWVAPNRFKKD